MNTLRIPLEYGFVDVTFTFESGTPGYYSGPPENCYPDEEDQIEIVSVMYEGVDVYPILSESARDDIVDEIYEKAKEMHDDC